MKTLGERIKHIRGTETQEAFATRLGVSKGALGGYERNENSPSSDVVLKICSGADISVEWLMVGTGAMRPDEGAHEDNKPITERKWSGHLGPIKNEAKDYLFGLVVDANNKTIASQEREIETLKGQIDDLKAEIAELKQRPSLSTAAPDAGPQQNTA